MSLDPIQISKILNAGDEYRLDGDGVDVDGMEDGDSRGGNDDSSSTERSNIVRD